VPVFLSKPWLLALIPVGLAIMPINKPTILLLLVLTADVAVALLLAEDFRQYRIHTVSGNSAAIPIGLAVGRLRRHEAMRWLSIMLRSKSSTIDDERPLRGAHRPLLGATRCRERTER